jgi:DNA excision repair protein ERCC-2
VTDFFFRHDKPRMHQLEFMEDAYNAISEERVLLANAQTGCGKTDSALSAAITYAHDNDLTVFFLTPKIAQHKIAVDVVAGIAKKHKLNVRAVDLIGRRHACIDPVLEDLDHDGFYQSCEKKRKRETCEYYANAKGFNKVQEARASHLFKKMLKDYGAAKVHQDIVKLADSHNACPYEWMMRLAGSSNVIIADYYHFMIPAIRDILFLKTKKQLERSIVIVDEAHNLGRRVREQLSSTVSSFLFRRADKEMKLLGAEGMDLEKGFDRWAKERIKDSDLSGSLNGPLNGASFNRSKEKLVSKLGFDNFLNDLPIAQEELAHYFEELGLEFVERTNRKSASLKIAKFLMSWKGEEDGVIRLLRRKNGWFSLSKRFLDPSPGTSILNECHSAILMSGTLLPLEMHRDVLGLDENLTLMKRYPTPFDENNTAHIIAEGHTTRYSKRKTENYRTMADKIDRIIEHTPGGTAIFFPSYVVQNAVVPLMRSKNLLIQKEKSGPKDIAQLLKRFGSGGVLCGPQGGSLAEGVDYCNEEIKTAVIVGVALEEMSLEVEALIDFYEEKYSKGWQYGYMWPAVIKAMQAAGRGIRKETDRCAIVYMDERFAWKNYRTVFDAGTRFIITTEPERYVKEFWSE